MLLWVVAPPHEKLEFYMTAFPFILQIKKSFHHNVTFGTIGNHLEKTWFVWKCRQQKVSCQKGTWYGCDFLHLTKPQDF